MEANNLRKYNGNKINIQIIKVKLLFEVVLKEKAEQNPSRHYGTSELLERFKSKLNNYILL